MLFSRGTCSVSSPQHPTIKGHLHQELYELQTHPSTLSAAVSTTVLIQIELGKRHPSRSTYRRMMLNNGGYGLGNIQDEGNHLPEVCYPCQQRKQRVTINREPVQRRSAKLEMLHSDMAGPFPSFHGKSRYFIIYIDDCTRFTWGFTLKTKTSAEIEPLMQNFSHDVDSDQQCRHLRCDNGTGEYTSSLIRHLLADRHIRLEPCAPYTKHQNGVSKRKIQTIVNMMRTMLLGAHLDVSFWAKASPVAVHILNRLPTKSLNFHLPYKALNDFRLNLSYLRVFGCVGYMHIAEDICRKLELKSVRCILVGYVEGTTKLWQM